MLSIYRSITPKNIRICPVLNRLQSQSLSSTCPANANVNSSTTKAHHPLLTHVPSLPFVGSTIPSYSGIPQMGAGNDFDFWVKVRKKFGEFYTIGMPGFGNGLHGTTHVVTDPKEMAKVIRSEGKYPSGIVQQQWVLKKVMKEASHPLTSGEQDGFFGRGTDWKRHRTFLQTDLLSPQAAAGYLPGVIHAAELASRGAPASNNDLNTYLNHCAFDMFCTVMFGILSETADPNTPTDPENLEFCNAAKVQLATNNIMNRDPTEIVLGKIFGIQTDRYATITQAFNTTERIGSRKIKQFIAKKKEGSLSEFEGKSWLSHAIDRQHQTDNNVTEEEMRKLAGVALSAAVDTTSGLLSWNLLQIAVHPRVQEKLYDEISNAVAQTGGKLTPEILQNRSRTPYLHAVIRETHRLTPTAPINVAKKVASDIEIHGQTFPEGTFFVFDSYSSGRDPNLVDDPDIFCPERWLPDAIAARKGTPKSIIDNQFYREPFSQGYVSSNIKISNMC